MLRQTAPKAANMRSRVSQMPRAIGHICLRNIAYKNPSRSFFRRFHRQDAD